MSFSRWCLWSLSPKFALCNNSLNCSFSHTHFCFDGMSHSAALTCWLSALESFQLSMLSYNLCWMKLRRLQREICGTFKRNSHFGVIKSPVWYEVHRMVLPQSCDTKRLKINFLSSKFTFKTLQMHNIVSEDANRENHRVKCFEAASSHCGNIFHLPLFKWCWKGKTMTRV